MKEGNVYSASPISTIINIEFHALILATLQTVVHSHSINKGIPVFPGVPSGAQSIALSPAIDTSTEGLSNGPQLITAITGRH